MEYSLKKFLKSPIPLSWLPYLLLGLSLLGFLDATYLTIVHYKNAIPPCTIHGCEVVLTSKFATIGSIPISLIGAGFYLVLVVLGGVLLSFAPHVIASRAKQSNTNKEIAAVTSFPRNDKKDGSPIPTSQSFAGRGRSGMTNVLPSLLFVLTLSGLLVGIYLVYLQAFVLHAFCQYCLASEVIDFLLFDTAWWLTQAPNHKPQTPNIKSQNSRVKSQESNPKTQIQKTKSEIQPS